MPWRRVIDWDRFHCGLSYYDENLRKNTHIPLTQVDVNVDIVGDFFAEVVVHQHFVNKTQEPPQSVSFYSEDRSVTRKVSYVFPLEESAAVCGFKATLGSGVVIEGISKEKVQARREFNEAVRQGKKAALLDQQQQDTFMCEIGNLAPGETCVVELRYITELPVENGAVKLVIPTVIAPRYKMQKKYRWGFGRYPVVRSSRYGWRTDPTRDVSHHGPYPLSITVNGQFSSKLLSVKSPTHKIYSHKKDGANDGEVKVELVGPKMLHPDISCKQCKCNFITGEKYSCATCPNYTVCEGCLEGHQHDHPLILQEEKVDDSDREEHRFVQCDGCNSLPLRGPRYKCTTCPDFDFCENCHQFKKQQHGHEFQRVYQYGLDALVPQFVQDQVAKCKKGHSLTFYERSPSYNYQTGFFCDECDINLLCEFGLHHCNICSYDLCKKCYTKNSPFLKVEPFSSSDIVFLFKQEFPYKTRSLVGYSPKHQSTTLQVTFCREQRLETTDLPCELIFIADTSGSMAGMSMENLKKTMQLFLRSLPTNCRFNLIEFDFHFRRLYEASKQMSKHSLEAATRYVDGWRAGGGTEILKPLEWILKQTPIPGYPRQVFLLTDGGVSNANQVVRTVHKYASSTRVFTFGIGSGVSRFLCKGVARAGNGTCEFVDSHEVSDKVMRTMERALQPPYFGAKVDWSPFDARLKQGYFQCPELLPPMYPGERYFVYAIQKGGGDETKEKEASKFDNTCVIGEFECDNFRVKVADDMSITLSTGKTATLKQIAVDADTKMWLLDDAYFLDEQNSTDNDIAWMLRYQYYSKGWKRTVSWKRIGKSKNRLAFEQSLIPQFDDFHIPIDGKVPSLVQQEGQTTTELVKVSLEGLHTGDILHCLAARAKIRELEKQPQTDDVKKAIIELGTNYNLASQYTSFVAVQKTTKPEKEGDQKQDGEISIQVIENEEGSEGLSFSGFGSSSRSASSGGGFSSRSSASSGGGFGSGFAGSFGVSSSASSSGGPILSFRRQESRVTYSGRRARRSSRGGRGGGGGHRDRDRDRSRGHSPEMRRRVRSRSRSGSRGRSRSRSPGVSGEKEKRKKRKVVQQQQQQQPQHKAPNFDAIVRLQQFDGSWDMSSELTSMANDLMQRLKVSDLFRGVGDKILATCVALLLLGKHFSAQKDSWRILETKARRFLLAELQKSGRAGNLEKMLQW